MAVGLKGTRTVASAQEAGTAQPPAYFYRLSARAQRTYLKGNSIERFDLVVNARAFSLTEDLMRALDFGAPSAVEHAAQSLLDELCGLLDVRSVHVEVRGVRPHNARGELHGIFYPRGPGRADTMRTAAWRSTEALIALWMRTARRHDVVKPKTFLRTLMHELGHYLDYALLGLDDSFHNTGFFKRESFLVRALYQMAPSPENR